MTSGVVGMVVLGLAACNSSGSESSGSPAVTAGSASSGTPVITEAAAPDVFCVQDIDQVIAAPSSARSKTAALAPDLVTTLDTAAAAAVELIAAPGAIVGVRTPDGTWTKAYGLADPATGEPMAVGMHTRIGSITKTFTVTAVLQLAQEGRLSLDDPIDEYTPGVPNGDRVTLRMLANMTSGVPSYTFSPTFTDVYFSTPDKVITPDEVLAIGISEPAMFEPGAHYFYSNTNLVLLGKVIEEVTGQPVAAVFEGRIFEPLGLANTSAPGESAALPEPYAHGFSLQGHAATPEHPSDATHWNPAWAYTAGELISDIDDLLTYGHALGTGQGLLDPAMQAQRLTSFPDVSAYSYGLGMGCQGGWVGHVGELPGYNSTLFHHTATNTTVAVQTNSDMASGDCTRSPLPADNPAQGKPCSTVPAGRVFQAVAAALGHPVEFPPED